MSPGHFCPPPALRLPSACPLPALLPALCLPRCHWRGPSLFRATFPVVTSWLAHSPQCVCLHRCLVGRGHAEVRGLDGKGHKQVTPGAVTCARKMELLARTRWHLARTGQLWGPHCLSAVALRLPQGPANQGVHTSPAVRTGALFPATRHIRPWFSNQPLRKQHVPCWSRWTGEVRLIHVTRSLLSRGAIVHTCVC